MSPPPRRMRLLMTTDAVGGVWVQATTLARALCRRHYAVTLVTLGPAPRSDQVESLRDIPGLDLVITDLQLEWMDPAGADLARALESLRRIERRVGPDLVHLNGYREAMADWHAPIVVGAHSCVGSWWRACRPGSAPDASWAPYLANLRAGLAAADLWVSPTAAIRDAIQALYDPPTRGRAIWNGLDLRPASSAKQPFVLAAGRLWDEAKNIPALAAAAPGVAWPIRVAGALSSDGKAIAPPPSGVEWLGALPRRALLGEMAQAAIFAAPALYEPFGLTVLEAASAGCALVLADIPPFRELWDGAALFVDPRDPTQLRRALTLVIRNDTQRAVLQRHAARRARRYTESVMADRYCEAYETLAVRRKHNRISHPLQPVEATP